MPLAAETASSGSGLLTFLPIILIFAAMYFLMIRPQSKRRREAMMMQSQLSPGDEVQTVGGMLAVVSAVDDDAVTLEVSPGVELRYLRNAIARVIRSPAAEQAAAEREAEEAAQREIDEREAEQARRAAKTIDQD